VPPREAPPAEALIWRSSREGRRGPDSARAPVGTPRFIQLQSCRWFLRA